MNWIEIIAAPLLVTTIIFLTYKNIKYRSNFNQLATFYMQTLSDNQMLNQGLEELKQKMENDKLLQSDGFVKFLSTSREWAFNYIEQVQGALEEFDHTVNQITEWNRTYGTALSDNLFSNKIEEISLAYERLQSLLPKDNETPNN